MRRSCIQAIVLLSFTVFPPVVAADAITGATSGVSTTDVTSPEPASEPRSEETSTTRARSDATPLFDATGSSLLLIMPPQFLNLFEPREKLRSGSGAGPLAAGGGDGGGSLIQETVLVGLSSGVSSSAIGNVGSAADSDSGGATGPSGSASPAQIPEPSALLLISLGLAVAARRFVRP